MFLDRIRKKYGSQVRHWIVAEFGSKRGRLHYHGILFDINIGNDELANLWQYGNTFVGYANEITAKYIVKYLTKQDTKGISPPRIISSKGIGLSWLNTPEAKLAKHSFDMVIYVNGLPCPIPRYYITKLYSEDDLVKISYYYYMETPQQDVWYLQGRKYTNFQHYEHARQSLLSDYKRYGFLYDDYIPRNKGLSSDTVYRTLISYLSEKQINLWQI